MYLIVGYPHLITLVPPISTVDHVMYKSLYPCCPITVIYSVLSIQHSNFPITGCIHVCHVFMLRSKNILQPFQMFLKSSDWCTVVRLNYLTKSTILYFTYGNQSILHN